MYNSRPCGCCQNFKAHLQKKVMMSVVLYFVAEKCHIPCAVPIA